jgi:hypothetical protein
MKAEYKLVNLSKDNSDIDCSNCPIAIVCIIANGLSSVKFYKRIPFNLLTNAINYDKSIIDVDTNEDLNYLKELSDKCYNGLNISISRKEHNSKYKLNRTVNDSCCDTCALLKLCGKYCQAKFINKTEFDIEKFAKDNNVNINDLFLIKECNESSVDFNIIENKD